MSVPLSAQVVLARRVQENLSGLADAFGGYAATLEEAVGAGAVPSLDVDVPEARGPRQQEVLHLLSSLVVEAGLKTAEISRAINMEQPNTYLTLQALTKQGLVELVPGVEPQHWRMAPRFRLGQKIRDVASLVRPGEWTSYGDISQVVYGHAKGAQAVAAVASSRLTDFPNPHRVLEYTGRIPAKWTDRSGQNAQVCADLLRAEGVDVDQEMFAHGRHHVTHEELSARLDDDK